MPRQPTGNPRGRPVGSGRLDAPRRITVWLPGDIYEKLTIYAEGRRGTRGGHPQLARCVREAITHYLFCPEKGKRQTPRQAEAGVEPPAPQSPPRQRKRQGAAD